MTKHKDMMPGGLADKNVPEDFDLNQLKKGIRHEMEHTDDTQLAKEIAMDHLAEDPYYYDKLSQIEEIKSYIKAFLYEYWSQHTDMYMEPEDNLPDNEEPGTMNDDPKNPYKAANSNLSKVKANAHPKTTSSQRAGVHRGSGTPGGGRNPGGTRQGFMG